MDMNVDSVGTDGMMERQMCFWRVQSDAISTSRIRTQSGKKRRVLDAEMCTVGLENTRRWFPGSDCDTERQNLLTLPLKRRKP